MQIICLQNVDSRKLLDNPELYKKIAGNKLLSIPEFIVWFLLALWHAVVTFFGFYLYFDGHLNVTSDDYLGKEAFGLAVYRSAIIVVSVK